MSIVPILAPLAVLLIGMIMLWFARLTYDNRGTRVNKAVRGILAFGGAMLVVIGCISSAAAAGFALGIPLFFVVVGVLIATAIRYHRAERLGLMSLIAAGIRTGVPLPQLLNAFTFERPDALSERASLMVDCAEQGMSLSQTLHIGKVFTDANTVVAIEAGQQTGAVGLALDKVIEHDDDTAANTVRSLIEKCCHLGLIVCMMSLILTFVMIKIVPVFIQMFEDFGLKLPAMTEMLIAASEWSMNTGAVAILGSLLPLGMLLLFLFYIEVISLNSVPLVNRLAVRLDRARVLRALYLPVATRQPVDPVLLTLAETYPKPWLRRRLTNAAEAVAAGQPVWDALENAGVLRSADTAVLKSAERAGNLPWAIDNLASSQMRRHAYWLDAINSVTFPFAILAIGCLIGFIAIALFVPLVSLIQGLT